MKALRLIELADRREALPEQRALMADLGASRRLAAVRPLARSWAPSAQVGRPKRRWFSSGKRGPQEEAKTADQALRALHELWSRVLPNQYNLLDQELRAGGYWSSAAGGAWWQLSPRAAIDSLPDSGELRAVGLGVLCCHPSGHVREAALRELAKGSLASSLPFLLVRANDWVRQVRAVAYARLLALDEHDVEELAPLLELVQQLASQERREPGAVEHLLNLLRTPRGLGAVQDCWKSAAPSLRRAAVRFSFGETGDRDAVLRAAVDSHDAVLRRWAVGMLCASDDPSRVDTFRRLSRDPIPMVATAALDALDSSIEPADVEMLKELRCSSSPGLQHTARFMLEKHFGEGSHREVYLSLLASDDERSHLVAAIGLAATGEPEDHRLLLSSRLGARSKVRQQLLRAAAGLDAAGARTALFEDVGHDLRGVSKLAARLSHWVALPLILQATRDPDSDAADEASRLVEKWIESHFHGIYRAAEPSEAQEREVRAEMLASDRALSESASERLERALAGDWGP